MKSLSSHAPAVLACLVASAVLIAASASLALAAPLAELPAALAPTDFSCDNVTEIPKAECEALVVLYNSTNGSGWKDNTGWLQTNTPCHTWAGVGCAFGHVDGIFKGDGNLSGTLPPQLGSLVELHGLYLANNLIGGSIPRQFGQLKKLESLSLSRNQLAGAIPGELATLPDLYTLDLSGNLLEGEIPASLGALASLTYLDLGGNTLESVMHFK